MKNSIYIFIIIIFLSSSAFCSSVNGNKIITYPIPSSAVSSRVFKIEADNVPVFVWDYKDINYAHFSSGGSADILVTVNEPVKDFSISPHSYNIKGRPEGNSIKFEIKPGQKLVIRINQFEKLFLFADRIEKNEPQLGAKNVKSILSFNVDNTGKIPGTKKIQEAIKETSNSGEILFFPPGIYLTGTLSVKSNSRIYIAGGALIQGIPDRSRYPVDSGWKESDMKNDPEHWSNKGDKMTYSRLILIDSAENVKLSGHGIIDGSGKIIRGQGKPANLIRIRRSKNVEISGLVLRDPAAWNTHILFSDSVIIKDVKIINDRTVKNTDGIDPDASTNILIDGCFIYGSDDNIAVKSSKNSGLLQDDCNITVKNCVFLTKKSAMKLGTETFACFEKNITFENNDVVEADRAMSLYSMDGAVFENIKWINDRVEDCYPDNQQSLLYFRIGKRGGIGGIKNVLIKNCTFEKYFPNSSKFQGADAEHEIDGVHFDNLRIADRLIRNAKEAHLKMNKFVKNVTFSVN